MISHPPHPTLLHRLVAVAALLLVLALTVLAASPHLHARLHADDAAHSPDEQGCVVTLFAQGVEPLLAAAFLIFAPLLRVIAAPPSAREVFLVAPRFLRLPERGPPGS